MRKQAYLLSVVLVVAGMAVSAQAQAKATGAGSEQHYLSGFLGGSKDGSKSGFTFGALYEYRLEEMFGIGGLIEQAEGDCEKTMAVNHC